MTRARVLLLTAALGPPDYRRPPGGDGRRGGGVVAPPGPGGGGGGGWGDEGFGAPDPVGDNRLRNLFEVVPVPPIRAPLRRLVEWTSDYYLAPPGSVLRMVLPGAAFADARRPIVEYRATGERPARMTPQRTVALEKIGARQGIVRELAAAGQLRDAVAARGFETLLLDGVTGSGKTEVYMEAIAAAIDAGRQALVLLPEIALTEPMLTRFAARFGCEPVAWHSGLRSVERRRAWHAIASGEAKIVVGARSALFLPYANLGVIVVDEAHETSFKQEDGVHYHARDVAVMRGHFEGLPVILASATPALESLAQVEAGR